MSVLSKMFLNEPRGEMVTFKKGFSIRLVLLFTVLTVVLTATVILTWEKVLKPPYYRWIERNYPGPANADNRDKLSRSSLRTLPRLARASGCHPAPERECRRDQTV